MERSYQAAWETRFDWTLTALMLAAFALAIYVTGLSPSSGRRELWAALIAGAYIVTLQVLPRRLREQQVIGEIVAVVGVVALTASIALTDADNAGYTMLLVTPIFFSSAFMGLRIGMETAVLATIGLVAVLLANGISPLEQVNVAALYLLVGFTLAQARRLLVLEQSLTARLRAASELDAARLSRLEEAHLLLVDLAEVVGTTDLSAVGVGTIALRELEQRFPIVGGEVVDSSGRLLATTGEHRSGEPETFPIEGSDDQLGTIRLWSRAGSTIESTDTHLVSTLSGVALALDNIQLLRTVAARAVQDERSRVARDLHDHIGPELASVGLTLDMMIHGDTVGQVDPQLLSLRERMTHLVEQVRSTVADLRHADTTTVLDHLHRLVFERGPELPGLTLDVDELEPLTGMLATEVASIVTEALRNADQHSGAKSVHIAGKIDQYGGYIAVRDDGKGFDPEMEYPGHFGLVGMRERAVAIGGQLRIISKKAGGSTVEVTWGDRMGEIEDI